MKALQYHPIPAFDDNYIWLVTDGVDCLVVDPGEAAPVTAYCKQHGLRLRAILLTHHHHDHVGGVESLLAAWPESTDIRVYGPAGEDIPNVSTRLSHGGKVRIEHPAFEATVIDVPGHTLGHIAYYQPAEAEGAPHLFCGDTLFASGCGRLFEGTSEQMLASLDILAGLPSSTHVHCAHEYTLSNALFAVACEPGNGHADQWLAAVKTLRTDGQPTLPTTIGHEKAVNPFLRVDEPTVQARLTTRFGAPVTDRLTAFTLMRLWKDRFH
ncbi:hydroxyacylglutathione hydrolase [Pandoraea terrae]|uniref:Hydroxyacylglutathione hydrolase n=1 Tax=Pandoraea terrae TaxID=1537710 RepID=A0A5E4XXC1_9BURK|nr:hydroxyacylglutathione hydrolase [Pandoraea terrae]VVE40705.1 hydroxyacylglutathione hydrolase [Pandoraea terrae]